MKIFKPYIMDNYGRDVILRALVVYRRELINLVCPEFKRLYPDRYRRIEKDLVECEQVQKEIENLKS